MKRIVSSLFLLAGLFMTSSGVAADKPLVIDVWPGKPADDNASTIGEEKNHRAKGQWKVV